MDIKTLNVLGIIGFDGITKHGLQLHPDEKHFIYSMGNKITIKNRETGEQNFLSGHSNVVTTLRLSPCGKYIASGQLTHLGFKAMVIIWNYDEKKMKSSYEIHKGKIEDVCFTCKSNYLISLGGKDDGNLVVWDINNNMALCGSFASTEIAGNALTITKTNLRDECFLTGGDCTLKVWYIDAVNRKLHGINAKVGKLRRCINCIAISSKDEEAYCGTSTGDIIHIRLNYDNDLNHIEPAQTPVMVGCYSKITDAARSTKNVTGELYSCGIYNIISLSLKKLVVAAGDGTIEIIEIISMPKTIGKPSKQQVVKLPTTPQIKTIKKTKVRGIVTSLIQSTEQKLYYAGTSLCEIYNINSTNFDSKLSLTCHTDSIYDVAFPHNYSVIFATGSKNDIRLWHIEFHTELLRITVPNVTCTNLCFSHDGKLILSAWNDGVVRAFKPQSGQLFFAIENAHLKAVSAIGITKKGNILITGGCDGQVRIWEISKNVQRLKAILKEHRGPITNLDVSVNDDEIVSSSTDGTCIIWDINECARKHVMMGNTMFMAAKYNPNNLQILTCGTDRKIGYWETLDGSKIRELEGSTIGSINCIDISSDGQYFVTGGNDYLIRIWEYISGDITYIGKGHAAIITACKFSYNKKKIVTTSADGAVIIWNNPYQINDDEISNVKSSPSVKSSSSSLRKTSHSNIEENIGNITPKSNFSLDTVRAVHQSKHNSEKCEYDPIKPSEDICQSQCDEKSHLQENQAQSIPSESLSKSNPVRRISAKANVLLVSTESKK